MNSRSTEYYPNSVYKTTYQCSPCDNSHLTEKRFLPSGELYQLKIYIYGTLRYEEIHHLNGELYTQFNYDISGLLHGECSLYNRCGVLIDKRYYSHGTLIADVCR